ncbi:MAG: hypothetical protein Q4F67_07310 [Propionibacteriaceae bacterium]|nr:hypothetical protein [Propionibacteriaceae bacterium]
MVNTLLLLGLIGIGIFGIVRTSGRTRALVAGGIGALVLSRLLGIIVPIFTGLFTSSTGSSLGIYLAFNVIGGLITLAGILLLVLAAVRRREAAHYPNAGNLYAPGGPGGPGYPGGPPPGGWQ